MKRIYHLHHIVPKHMGGTDDKSNLKRVTVRQHALEHKKLYEKYGKWEDEIAYRMLSGQISSAEATRLAQSMANKNKTPSQIQACMRNLRLATESNIGRKHSKEWKSKQSKGNKKYWGKVKDRPWQKKTFIIDNKTYYGIDGVEKHLGIKMSGLYYRLKSPKYPNWKQGSFKLDRKEV